MILDGCCIANCELRFAKMENAGNFRAFSFNCLVILFAYLDCKSSFIGEKKTCTEMKRNRSRIMVGRTDEQLSYKTIISNQPFLQFIENKCSFVIDPTTTTTTKNIATRKEEKQTR